MISQCREGNASLKTASYRGLRTAGGFFLHFFLAIGLAVWERLALKVLNEFA